MKMPLIFAVSLIALLLARVAGAQNPIVERGNLPNRVHAFEDFETEIEKRWWLRGMEEKNNLPPSLGSLLNARAWRSRNAVDPKDQKAVLNAVMFNPVPGPAMGKNTRLFFRYRLIGSGNLKVQIFSLTQEDNYSVVLHNLPQDQWQSATVDMTQLTRNDGSAGRLSEDERIDDIQFYVDPGTQVSINDIVLFDAAAADEKEPFPARIIFTAGFDTGEQGKEWPGDYLIVAQEKPRRWKMAASVMNEVTKTPWLRIALRGLRPLPEKVRLRFKYKYSSKADKHVDVILVDKLNPKWRRAQLKNLVTGEWSQISIDLDGKEPGSADQLEIYLPAGAEMFIDDLLLYEPGK